MSQRVSAAARRGIVLLGSGNRRQSAPALFRYASAGPQFNAPQVARVHGDAIDILASTGSMSRCCASSSLSSRRSGPAVIARIPAWRPSQPTPACRWSSSTRSGRAQPPLHRIRVWMPHRPPMRARTKGSEQRKRPRRREAFEFVHCLTGITRRDTPSRAAHASPALRGSASRSAGHPTARCRSDRQSPRNSRKCRLRSASARRRSC